MNDEMNGKKGQKSRRLSVKDIANYYVPQFQTLDDIQQKPYARHLIKNERVIYDGIVWKRSVRESNLSSLIL